MLDTSGKAARWPAAAGLATGSLCGELQAAHAKGRAQPQPLVAAAPTKRSYQSQQGFSFLGVFALLLCLSSVLGTIQTIWGPVYEETCTPVTAEQEKNAAKINAAISSPFGGDYVPSPSCSKQLVR